MKCNICDDENADSYYKDKSTDEIVCQDCLLEKYSIQVTTTQYYDEDSNYLGSDEDIKEVLDNICSNLYYEEVEVEL